MITYLKKQGEGVDACLVGSNAENATHFTKGEHGEQFPISELTAQMKSGQQKKTTKQKTTTEETETPLDMPTLNFGEEEQAEKDEAVLDDNVLDLPSTAPKHEENQQEVKMHEAGAAKDGAETPLTSPND